MVLDRHGFSFCVELDVFKGEIRLKSCIYV
jgi:hypothetical protein